MQLNNEEMQLNEQKQRDPRLDILNKIKTGKDSTVEYVVGQVMRETRGKADPVLIRKVIKELTSM